MILTADYHTHTPYSHGKNTIDENASQAKRLGLKQLGIADHGFSHVAFGIRRREVSAYRAECRAAREKYGLDVLVGIEANILGESGKADLTEKDFENFDFYLCGKHVFVHYEKFSDVLNYGIGNFLSDKIGIRPGKDQIKRNTKAYINAIEKNPLDAITHLNYLCVSDALEVAKCAADHGTYLELNSKKKHLSDDELAAIVQKTDVRFIIGSDAHSAERVGDTERVKKQLERIGFPMERIDNIDGRLPTFRFTEFKRKL